MGFVADWKSIARGVELRAKVELPATMDVAELRELLSKKVTEFNKRYGSCINEFIAQQNSKRSMLGVDGELEIDEKGEPYVLPSSAGWWVIPNADVIKLSHDAKTAKRAITRLWNKISFAKAEPDKLFQAALRIEFGTDAKFIVARDTYPTMHGTDFLDSSIGTHLIDHDTFTEIDKTAKAGMSGLAYEIKVIADHLHDLLNSQSPLRPHGRVLQRPAAGWGNRALEN